MHTYIERVCTLAEERKGCHSFVLMGLLVKVVCM
jgi:hypothetical protein